MIRASTLLPAFIVVFGLAGASLAMADDSGSSNTTQTQTQTQQANNPNACNDAPQYLQPDYCQVHDHHRKH